MSFSRKAADEARTRASSALNMNPDQMVWFRTLHSMAFQYQGLGSRAGTQGHRLQTDWRYTGVRVFIQLLFERMADGQLFSPGKGGDAYLSMIQLARVREISIEQQFNDTNNRHLHYQQLKVVDEVLRDYKRDTGKLDFVDMIDRFIVEEQAPRLEVLIVDEAQDLAPIQWRMVHDVLKPRAKRIYFAGDDDQCIYSWMGVNVRDFLNASDNKMVLDKSYRLPRNIYNIADSLVNRVVVRQPKVWSPVSEAGQVVWHHDIMDLNFNSGEWLILARTNYIANKIATDLKEQGYLFWREGSGWSISPNVLTGIEVWLKLCKGLTVYSNGTEDVIYIIKIGYRDQIWKEELSHPRQRNALRSRRRKRELLYERLEREALVRSVESGRAGENIHQFSPSDGREDTDGQAEDQDIDNTQSQGWRGG